MWQVPQFCIELLHLTKIRILKIILRVIKEALFLGSFPQWYHYDTFPKVQTTLHYSWHQTLKFYVIVVACTILENAPLPLEKADPSSDAGVPKGDSTSFVSN